jgi:hypothetical protein
MVGNKLQKVSVPMVRCATATKIFVPVALPTDAGNPQGVLLWSEAL